MFYRRRASPKHRYDIIEVDYGGGGHRTRLRDQEIHCCVYGVPPSSVYKGGGEGWPRGGGAPKGGVLLPPGVGLLLFLFGEGEGRKRKERGAGPLPNSDWAWGEPPPLLLSPPFH